MDTFFFTVLVSQARVDEAIVLSIRQRECIRNPAVGVQYVTGDSAVAYAGYRVACNETILFRKEIK